MAGQISVSLTQEGDLVSSEELPFVHLAVIKAATDGFSDSNKLGQGGFGTVYKVTLYCPVKYRTKDIRTKIFSYSRLSPQ